MSLNHSSCKCTCHHHRPLTTTKTSKMDIDDNLTSSQLLQRKRKENAELEPENKNKKMKHKRSISQTGKLTKIQKVFSSDESHVETISKSSLDSSNTSSAENVLKKDCQSLVSIAPMKNVSTLSIAVPGSILENCQTDELRAYMASQIARSACIYNVDEIIIFDDLGSKSSSNVKVCTIETAEGTQRARQSLVQLARILQYLECPQYLRKYFFPTHKDLRNVGLLPPLDAPHHLRADNNFEYREGVVINKPTKTGRGSWVHVGLNHDCLVDKTLTPGLRVTVQMQKYHATTAKLRGVVVSPTQPRRHTGVYWGYTVRIANTLSDVLTQSQYKDGYDLSIGTSDKGENIYNVQNETLDYDHCIVVFGGLKGIEAAVENDDKLDNDYARYLFDHYFNTIPNQGSRTVRTEEAILITLATLQSKLEPVYKPPPFIMQHAIAQSEDTGLKQQIQKSLKKKPSRVYNSDED